MLSSVLNSKQAIEVNIQIMRVFVKMREWVKDYRTLLRRIEKLEQRGEQRDQAMKKIYDLLTQFMKEKKKPRKRIGFKTGNDQISSDRGFLKDISLIPRQLTPSIQCHRKPSPVLLCKRVLVA